jgi:hypothetical protein
MATLSVQTAAIAGTAVTFAAAAGGGDQFANSGNERFVVKNGGGSPITVTIDSPGTCSFGTTANAAHDLAVAVAAGAETMIGPFATDKYSDSNGNVQITYSGVTTVTVAVVRR